MKLHFFSFLYKHSLHLAGLIPVSTLTCHTSCSHLWQVCFTVKWIIYSTEMKAQWHESLKCYNWQNYIKKKCLTDVESSSEGHWKGAERSDSGARAAAAGVWKGKVSLHKFSLHSAWQVLIWACSCVAGSAGAWWAVEEADGGHPGRTAEERTEAVVAGEEVGSADRNCGEEGGSALCRPLGLQRRPNCRQQRGKQTRGTILYPRVRLYPKVCFCTS